MALGTPFPETELRVTTPEVVTVASTLMRMCGGAWDKSTPFAHAAGDPASARSSADKSREGCGAGVVVVSVAVRSGSSTRTAGAR